MHTDEYLTGPQLQARYSISDVTLWRWIRSDKLGFPKPMVINRLRYFRRDEIEAWDAKRRTMVAA